MKAIKAIAHFMTLSAALMALSGRPAAGAGLEERNDFLYEYLAGRYFVVGKALDSEKTYYGQVAFSYESGRLMVTRNIQGEVVRGEGTIEHALGPDRADVLRVRFVQGGQRYEITYLWRSDLDNYARLSGYLIEPGKQTDSPGMEALFINHAPDK